MILFDGVLGLVFFGVLTTDLFLLGCYLFAKTRNEWKK
jgi:hypothetical protein